MGYLREAVAIQARASRCRAAWKPHLERSRAFIMKAAHTCSGHGTALVIGSGALFDVPLAELSGMFGRVLLADIVHPLSARWQARRFANVRLITVDVTGLAGHLAALPSRCFKTGMHASVRAPLSGPPGFGDTAQETSSPLFLEQRPDFTVSANILSQLPLLPLARLKQAGYTADELAQVRRTILTGHLEWLHRLPGLVSLIADTQWRVGAAKEDPLSGLDPQLLHLLENAPSGETWQWDIAPKPEAYPDRDVTHLVRACILKA